MLDTLKAWDRRAAVDSVATTVFFLWFERYMSLAAANQQVPTADRVLEEVIADLERRWGTWEIPWGEINRLRRPGSLEGSGRSWPIAGGHGAAGVQATFLSRFEDENARQRFGYRGSGYVAVVELGNPIRSRSILPYGQSSVPSSPHFEDQAPFYAAGRMKSNPFQPGDVRAQAMRTYRPGGRSLAP